MIYVVCQSCKSGLRISSTEPGESNALFGPDSDYYPDRYPCHVCGASAAIVEAIDRNALSELQLADVNPAEAFAAIHGLGLPDERECSAAAVTQLLEKTAIARACTRPIRNSHRCVIDHVELVDGTKIYFGSSTHGAVVYRVTRKLSYADRVTQETHAGPDQTT